MKEKLGKEYEKDDNIVISQIVYECFKWKSIMYVVEGNKIINNIKKDINLNTLEKINIKMVFLTMRLILILMILKKISYL